MGKNGGWGDGVRLAALIIRTRCWGVTACDNTCRNKGYTYGRVIEEGSGEGVEWEKEMRKKKL